MKKEQTERRKRGGLEIQSFGDCRVEQAMWRKYIEVTKELKDDVKRRKGTLVISGGALDSEVLEEDGQELSVIRTTGR